MDLFFYLSRIGYHGSIQIDKKTLRALHFSHIQTVPFENLDIGLKNPIRLDEQSLLNKIIVNNRGGFCYELNGLFAWLLKQIGFHVTYLNARVYNQAGKLGIDFDHLALLVQIPGKSERWLADVGFGDSFTEPLNFDEKEEQVQGLRSYRLELTQEGYIVWRKIYTGHWERQYFFDLEPHKFPEEYESACLYHQTSPKSSFTRSSIISRATPDGRVSLEDGRLILTKNGKRTEKPITAKEYPIILKQYFGVEL